MLHTPCTRCGQWTPPALQVFELGGDVVPAAMAANLTRLIAEGSGNGDAEADNTMRSEVVASYLDLLQKPKLSDVLLTVCFSQTPITAFDIHPNLHAAPRSTVLLALLSCRRTYLCLCAFAQVILWVLGEYGSLADIGPSGVLRALSTLVEEHTLSDPVRGYLLTAMAKLAVQVSSEQKPSLPASAATHIYLRC
jgi:hypothetical protein